MDPDAPFFVAKNTAITFASTSFLSCFYATYKKLPLGPIAVGTAVNSGIAGATFFSLREYVVSPLLVSNIPSGQFFRRKLELDAKREGQLYRPERLDWWSMRSQKIPDSALSGAISGGFLNAWKRGRVGIPTGMTTGALLCTLLQLAYNELGVMRLKYISKKLQPTMKTEARSNLSISQPVPAATPETSLASPSVERVSWTDRVFSLFGLQKVSDEEYLARLKRDRDAHLQRIAELEKETEQTKSNTIDDSDTR